MEFSRQEYWSELPFPSLSDFPDPGIELVSLTLYHWANQNHLKHWFQGENATIEWKPLFAMESDKYCLPTAEMLVVRCVLLWNQIASWSSDSIHHRDLEIILIFSFLNGKSVAEDIYMQSSL